MKEKNIKTEEKTKKWGPVGDKFKGAKIAKTFRIDADVFLWLRQEAVLGGFSPRVARGFQEFFFRTLL